MVFPKFHPQTTTPRGFTGYTINGDRLPGSSGMDETPVLRESPAFEPEGEGQTDLLPNLGFS